MSYRFYGWETATVRDSRGLTPCDDYDLLSRLWCAETCAPGLRKDWSAQNNTLGQCSIPAFLSQDLMGGQVWGVPLPGGGVHCFNEVDGCLFDLTSEQFGGAALDYSARTLQDRETHFADGDKFARYQLLKSRLLPLLPQP